MRVIIRLFFRFIRLVLTPFMLLAEKLSTPSPMAHSTQQQQQLTQACQQLALYQFAACPFCIKVRKEIARLGLTIQKRDAQHNAEHRQQLQTGGGKVKVPCLQIKDDSGQTQWVYESDAIIAHLQNVVAATRS